MPKKSAKARDMFVEAGEKNARMSKQGVSTGTTGSSPQMGKYWNRKTSYDGWSHEPAPVTSTVEDKVAGAITKGLKSVRRQMGSLPSQLYKFWKLGQ